MNMCKNTNATICMFSWWHDIVRYASNILSNQYIEHSQIMFQHSLLKHAGVPQMVSSLCNEFWIIGLRRIAKRVKKACNSCQRQDAPACSQPMAPLPADRVNKAFPFEVTGLDHAGPLYCCDLLRKKVLLLFCIDWSIKELCRWRNTSLLYRDLFPRMHRAGYKERTHVAAGMMRLKMQTSSHLALTSIFQITWISKRLVDINTNCTSRYGFHFKWKCCIKLASNANIEGVNGFVASAAEHQG